MRSPLDIEMDVACVRDSLALLNLLAVHEGEPGLGDLPQGALAQLTLPALRAAERLMEDVSAWTGPA